MNNMASIKAYRQCTVNYVNPVFMIQYVAVFHNMKKQLVGSQNNVNKTVIVQESIMVYQGLALA